MPERINPDHPVERSGKRGRPPIKLTPELEKQICDALRTCGRLAACASVCGVSVNVLARWITKGKEKPRSKFGRFRRAIRKAEDAAEIDLSLMIRKNAAQDTGDAKWLLTHRPRWKKHWADTSRLEHKVAGSTVKEAAELARGLIDNDEVRKHLEAAAIAAYGRGDALEPAGVRDEAEPGPVED